MPEAEQSHKAGRFLTFRVDNRLFALPTEEVVEVIRLPTVARVPQAPKALLGVANLRGTILPLVSVRALLGSGDTGTTAARAIVLAIDPPAAVSVDSVVALVDIAIEKIERRQAELGADSGEKLIGAFDTGTVGVAKILDIKSLLDDAFAARAEKARQPKSALRSSPSTKQEVRASNVDSETLVTFEVAKQEYAISLTAVKEIISPSDDVAAIPGSEKIAVGVISFRENLLPLVSLRGLLGFQRAERADVREKIVVTSVGGTTVGLVVDRARAIVKASRDLIDPVPAVLAARSGGEARIKSIYRGEAGKRLISILAPDQLFGEDVMRRVGTAAQKDANDQPAAPAPERQFLVFRLGNDEFGLPVEAVDEVARVPDVITRIPKAPKFLEGVINLRGEVLPVVDQRKRFDLRITESGESRRLIVLRSDRHRAGLIVDGVAEVLRSRADEIESPPDLTGEITRLVRGVLNLGDGKRIVLLLDPAELLTRAERALLDTFEGKTKVAK